ncbi:hypothetical protein KKD19_02535 [Patescibacteria group bacterium]|nr:hypothetical protein [Patescibacteria group bacterium]MBU4512097.1 hypothetical protein [Patescibacteria group bacterium]MCG2693422.1 hypothetical protein [Candidatus Parcubacteria bacterium]
MTIAAIATKLNIPKATIEKESVRDFLERRLLTVETELFLLANKYGVRSIGELDNKIKKGFIHETSESREDFFKFDSLEAKRDTLYQLIKSS